MLGGGPGQLVRIAHFFRPEFLVLGSVGAISILLGVMIWRAWPVSGLWVIGMFIGIDMIVDGWTEIMLALSARSLPA